MRFVALVLVVFCLSANAAKKAQVGLQARDLIQEAEEVLRILGPKDPERMPVTLRLADLLFDAAIEIDSDSTTAADNRTADRYRDRAEVLYKDALPTLKAAQVQRVKFQLARIYSFKAQMASAIKYWKEIVESPGDAKLRRESALHWAEQLELSNNVGQIREAAELYRKALPLADKDSLRSYILYRTAWTNYRLGDAAGAVKTLQKGIALAVDKERDDLLRDLTLFMSRDMQPVTAQIDLIEGLEQRYERKGFLLQFTESLQAADRRGDYAVALEYLNKREPNLDRSVNILEAAHDGLDIDRVTEHLEGINDLRRKGGKFKSEAAEKAAREKLFRLVHLWDGHRRANKPGYSELLARGVTTMILLFPTHEETTKAMGGWLAAHNDPKIQLPQVDRWLALAREVRNAKMEISLTKTKLELARQTKDWPLVVEVSKQLENLTTAQTRPVRYQRAKALYELKNYAEALPLFAGLANENYVPKAGEEKDELQKLSQDLTLDILAIQKDFPQIIAFTSKWKGDPARMEEFRAMNEKARFEAAVAAQDAPALQAFTQFCLEKKFTPTSCDNAKSLSSKMRNQPTLITVLKAQGDEKELTRQLEVAGRFGESARLMEKSLKASADRMAWMKVALLYELQGELKERNRILSQLVKQLAKQKLSDQEQALIYLTLKDAGLIDEKVLALEWSDKMKMQLAGELYEQQNSKISEAMLAKSCTQGGLGWQKIHLRAMKDTYGKQAKITFTGAASKRKFEERVALLKTLGTQANCFKEGAPNEMSKAVSQKVGDAYAEFAKQIKATPIPEGIDEETLQEVQAQIEIMAGPFEKQAKQWHDLSAEITTVTPLAADWSFDAPAAQPNKTKPVAFDWQPYINDIQNAPFDKTHFEQWRAHFESKGSVRLAGYVKGRLEDLQ